MRVGAKARTLPALALCVGPLTRSISIDISLLRYYTNTHLKKIKTTKYKKKHTKYENTKCVFCGCGCVVFFFVFFFWGGCLRTLCMYDCHSEVCISVSTYSHNRISNWTVVFDLESHWKVKVKAGLHMGPNNLCYVTRHFLFFPMPPCHFL